MMMLIMLASSAICSAKVLVKGTVTDENNEALIGVNIVEKGTSNGTTSDFDGNYRITVSSFPATLVVSSVGFTTQEIEVTSAGTINVGLQDGVARDGRCRR